MRGCHGAALPGAAHAHQHGAQTQLDPVDRRRIAARLRQKIVKRIHRGVGTAAGGIGFEDRALHFPALAEPLAQVLRLAGILVERSEEPAPDIFEDPGRACKALPRQPRREQAAFGRPARMDLLGLRPIMDEGPEARGKTGGERDRIARGETAEAGNPGNGRSSRKRAAGARRVPSKSVVTVVSTRRFENTPAHLVTCDDAGDQFPS